MLFHAWLVHRSRACAPWLLTLGGCSGTDIGYPRVSDAAACPDVTSLPETGGGGGASGAGSPTTSAGRPATTGGSPSGNAGSSAGGMPPLAGSPATAGTASSGAPSAGAPATFEWPDAYDASAVPAPATGQHNAGASCMSSSCHGSKVPFVFGGTVYQADGVTGAPHVEVAISDGTLTLTAYSAENGNIWLPSSAGALDVSTAQIAIRNAKGERVKPASAGRGTACNAGGCHAATMRLLEP